MQHYPLPPHYCGVEHVAILEHIVASTALGLPPVPEGPELADAPYVLDVSLEPDLYTAGWRVRSAHGLLGFIDADEAAEFPDLERVRAAGMHVSTWASVELLHGEEEGIEVAVHLGLAPWQVARNNVPDGAVLLAPGQAVWVNPETSSDIVPSQLQDLGFGQYFVTLTRFGSIIVTALDDVVVGTCDGPAHVLAILEQAEQAGATVCARAYSGDGHLMVDLPDLPHGFAGDSSHPSADGAEENATELFIPAPPALVAEGEPVLSPRDFSASAPEEELWEASILGDTVSIPAPSGLRTFLPAPPVPKDIQHRVIVPTSQNSTDA